MKKWKRYLALVLALAALAVWAYVGDHYRADAAALEALRSDETVAVLPEKDSVAFVPAEPEAGLIFYPGGKVEHTAYAPLLRLLAEEKILCVLVQMPWNLAVLDPDAAADIPEGFPQIQTWYIAGHSLGGSMAASWAASNPDEVEGLALLASYSTSDLGESGLSILSIDGTQDGVINREKQTQYRSNLPQDAQYLSIPGGNHAQFGSYGPQDGDGIAAITPQEQWATTADALVQWIIG